MYDIMVIGKGLMGAAAIKHLALKFPDLSLAAIGPDEPENRKTHTGVFASHYDQGRITRILDRSPIWAHLAAESIKRYADIETQSGIQFHHAVGCLRVLDNEKGVQDVDTVAAKLTPSFAKLTPSATEARFPYFNFSGDYNAYAEDAPAGYINPRQLIDAQLKIAEQHGATIIRETVTKFQDTSGNSEFVTAEGNVYSAKKVLIAAGGFSNMLLPSGKADFALRAHNILLAEISQSEVERLHGMPSLIINCDHPDMPNLYMLPPVKYPDGKTYIKLGGSFYGEQAVLEDYLQTLVETKTWFQSDGRPDVADTLKAYLHTIISNLQVESYHARPCLITMTQHGQPYIDNLDNFRTIIAGGNGASAKSCDEMGRMGAMLCATGEWDSPLKREDFRLVKKSPPVTDVDDVLL